MLKSWILRQATIIMGRGITTPKWSIMLSFGRFKEKYPSFFPYNYAAQSPLRYLEINGDSLKIANNEITKEYLLSAVQKRNQKVVNFDPNCTHFGLK